MIVGFPFATLRLKMLGKCKKRGKKEKKKIPLVSRNPLILSREWHARPAWRSARKRELNGSWKIVAT